LKVKVLRNKIIAAVLITNLLPPFIIYAAPLEKSNYTINETNDTNDTSETNETSETSETNEANETNSSTKDEATTLPAESNQASETSAEQSSNDLQATPASEEEEEQPAPSAKAENSTSTNEELVASQQIVIPPEIEMSFRFVKVEKVFAIASEDSLNVYEEKDETSQVVGELQKDSLCYILENKDGNWIYIESGVVRGFVKAEELLTGDEAEAFVDENKEENLQLAKAFVEPLLNKSIAYTKTTIRATVAEKIYAVSKVDGLEIREGKEEEDRIIGTLSQDALCYILADENEEWVFVESEDVRGFVEKESLILGEEAEILVEEVGEENFTFAKEEILPEENAVCYYTLTSTKEESITRAVRSSMITFATQFIGNPYVWGGTSLTNGADCSGFVQSIYAQYGYSLPRVAENQALYGTQIPVEEAAMGDLIFYAKNGVVYHVVMYMGEGQVIHASTAATGIRVSGIDTQHAVWATRIITDSETADIENNDTVTTDIGSDDTAATDLESDDTVTADLTDDTESSEQIGKYVGRYILTAYCTCPLCSGQWSEKPTANGTAPIQGRTIAMTGLPLGTQLVINGEIYTVEDRGTASRQIGLYMDNHEEANAFNIQFADVYLAK